MTDTTSSRTKDTEAARRRLRVRHARRLHDRARRGHQLGERGLRPQMAEDVAVDISTTYDLFVLGRDVRHLRPLPAPRRALRRRRRAESSEGKEDPRSSAPQRTAQGGVLHHARRSRLGQHRGRRGVRTRSAGSRRSRARPSASRAAPASSTRWPADLVDEYHLYQHPVLLGTCRCSRPARPPELRPDPSHPLRQRRRRPHLRAQGRSTMSTTPTR